MTTDDERRGREQVPAACTLPTAEVPLRVTEFEELFAVVRAVQRPAPTRLLLALQPAAGRAEAARDLAARESACCSFFRFAVREADDGVLLEVTVPAAQVAVLDAMADRVAAAGGPS